MAASDIIKMCVAGQRKHGWTDAEFSHEFTVVHAAITKEAAEQMPALLAYRQVLAIPRPKISAIGLENSTWDSQAVLVWTSVDDLSAVLKSEEYRANAGKHIFTEPEILGSICQEFGNVMFDRPSYDSPGTRYMVFVYIPRSQRESRARVDFESLTKRLQHIKQIGQDSGILRYAINQDVTPIDPMELFEGTPFTTCEWGVFGITEQYWFKDQEAATLFFADEPRFEAWKTMPSSLDVQNCIAVAGKDVVLVKKEQA